MDAIPVVSLQSIFNLQSGSRLVLFNFFHQFSSLKAYTIGKLANPSTVFAYTPPLIVFQQHLR
jgi:hypothetical protein